jgi:hypothetical protein
MDDHASNPAGRLWLYFNHVRTNNAHKVLDLALQYFSAERVDARFMTSMAALLRLPNEGLLMIEDMKDSPLPEEKLKRPLLAASTYFTDDPFGTNSVAWMASYVDSGVMNDLETTSHILDRYSPGKTASLSADTLEEIKRLASSIADLAAVDEELDPEAREAFIRYAHRIREAADLYKVTGAQSIIDELDRFHQRARRMKTAPGSKLGETFKQLTACVLLAVELFTAPANMGEAIDRYQSAFSLDAITEAPGGHKSLEVINAELEDDNVTI